MVARTQKKKPRSSVRSLLPSSGQRGRLGGPLQPAAPDHDSSGSSGADRSTDDIRRISSRCSATHCSKCNSSRAPAPPGPGLAILSGGARPETLSMSPLLARRLRRAQNQGKIRLRQIRAVQSAFAPWCQHPAPDIGAEPLILAAEFTVQDRLLTAPGHSCSTIPAQALPSPRRIYLCVQILLLLTEITQNGPDQSPVPSGRAPGRNA